MIANASPTSMVIITLALIFSTPFLPKMVVKAAKNAERESTTD
jgi:hypothetical protein